VNGYCLNEFTFLHELEVIPSGDSKGGYPLTFLSPSEKWLFEGGGFIVVLEKQGSAR
jgi:hypothetical protein